MTKKIIALAFLMLPLQSFSEEEYVSPMEYKDYSCDELKEDYEGISNVHLENLLESTEHLGTNKGRELDKKNEGLEARLTAIEKAAAKINCSLKTKPSSTSSS